MLSKSSAADAASKSQMTNDKSQIEDEGDAASKSQMTNDKAQIDDESADVPDDDNSEFRIPNSGLEQALAAEKDRYLRLAAEYDNFRKRSVKEREMSYRDARADTITRLLPVYDNLERALKMECSDEAFYKGIEMTLTGLTGILEALDVSVIPAVGEQFDPNRHNAVMTVEKPELGEKIVAEEFQKGFAIGDRVIRFSTVVVAN